MAHLAFPDHCKSFKTPSSSTTYSYVYFPATTSTFTILFLHGFPSSSYDWRHQISHFSALGYGVLVPDLLGYGLTDKPDSHLEYNQKKMAKEVIEILDHENLPKIHGVAHDFGSHIFSRVLNYFPSRFHSASFLSVPYNPPGGHFDLDLLKKIMEQAIGFEKFGYMRFMNSEDSGKILDAHGESLNSLLYTSNPELIMNFYEPGALSKWLAADSRAPASSYQTPEEADLRDRIFKAGGYHAPTNWYRALVRNINEETEKADLEAGTIDPQIKCPVLIIDETPDPTSLPGFMEGSTRPFAETLTTKIVPTSGHWVQLQSRDEVNEMLGSFFKDVESTLTT